MMGAWPLEIVVLVFLVLGALVLGHRFGSMARAAEYAALRATAESCPRLQETVSTLGARVDELLALTGDVKEQNALLRAQLTAEQEARAHDHGALTELPGLRCQLSEAQQRCAGLEARAERLVNVEHAINELNERLTLAHEANTRLMEEKTRLATQLAEGVTRTEDREHLLAVFREIFDGLAAKALRDNNGAFMDLAREALTTFQATATTDLEGRQRDVAALVAPVGKALEKLDAAIHGLEKDRVGAYSSLVTQVDALQQGQTLLTRQTTNLVKALRTPSARGRWGEIGLKRVMEMAGMVEHCDFTEQAHIPTEDSRLRPDAVVHLPGDKSIVVDAKVPLTAYLEALDVDDDTGKKVGLREHARLVRKHITDLGSKAYWDQLPCSPEFVVMYLPIETAFAAAVQEEPSLLDYAVERSVIPAGPLTLLAHLKAAAYGWRQERIAANAQHISDLGKDLYNRLRILTSHFCDMGEHLGGAVEAYNAAAGSLERRVLVQARRFKELGAATGEDLEEPELVDVRPRGGRSLPGPPAVGADAPNGVHESRERANHATSVSS